MMSSLLPDLSIRIHPEPPPCTFSPLPLSVSTDTSTDLFDQLPDSLLLLIFNKIADVKSLGRCSSVSTRFHSLIPLVQNVVVPVDCVISDNDVTRSDKSHRPISNLLRIVLSTIFKPIQNLLFASKQHSTDNNNNNQDSVTHHSPAQVLQNFTRIRFLNIQLPVSELGLDDHVFLRWKAEFGSALRNCVILGASGITYPNCISNCLLDQDENNNNNNNNDNGSIPDSFYTNGGLKLRVVWTISSLIAASARHYLLQPIVCDHETLESLTLTDADGQGVLCMNREELEELRVKPLMASSASKRTLVPGVSMRLWYAPCLELPDGTVMRGATLVCTRPSEGLGQWDGVDGVWVSGAFEEPFGTAAKMLVKRRTYCLEMNSF